MNAANKSHELFNEIAGIIQDNERFLIITHDFPDGDCLGSQIALYDLLKSLKKDAHMLCSSDIPYQYNFLPHIDKIKFYIKDIYPSCIHGKCVCFFLDSADQYRFSFDMNEIKEKCSILINIDHHLGNSLFGDINIIDCNKSATAEIVYEMINLFYKKHLNYNIALGIYTGILTDTGRFQYNNTTGNVHKIVSRLLEFGVVPSHVFSAIYENEPFDRFKLLEIVLKRIKLIKSKKLIYSYVLDSDFSRLKLPFSANDGVIEILRGASDAKIAALFKQVKGGSFKVSLRSSDDNFSVVDIAAKFGGGGHKLAAAYSQKGTIKKLLSDLIKAME